MNDLEQLLSCDAKVVVAYTREYLEDSKNYFKSSLGNYVVGNFEMALEFRGAEASDIQIDYEMPKNLLMEVESQFLEKLDIKNVVNNRIFILNNMLPSQNYIFVKVNYKCLNPKSTFSSF